MLPSLPFWAKVILSPLLTIAAIILAIALDVSWVAMWLAGGWAVAVGLLVIGYGLCKLGQYLDSTPVPKTEAGCLSRFFKQVALVDAGMAEIIYADDEIPMAVAVPL